MTSPDGAGLPSGPEKIGQWSPLVALQQLGAAIMSPLTMLFAFIRGYAGIEPPNNEANLEMVGTEIQNRITALEDGGVEHLFTSSATIDLHAFTTVKVVMFGSSPFASASGVGTSIGDPSPGGGFMSCEYTVAELAAAGLNTSAIQVNVGTSGNPSWFGSSSFLTTSPGVARRLDPFGNFDVEGPAAGGKGGRGGDSSVSTAGSPGANSTAGPGGAGGSRGTGSAPSGAAGSPGTSADFTRRIKLPGAGGGGGGGGGVLASFNGWAGGAGGNGGFPGGGPGSGGSGAQAAMAGDPGPSGARANGAVIAYAY